MAGVVPDSHDLYVRDTGSGIYQNDFWHTESERNTWGQTEALSEAGIVVEMA